MQVCIRTAVEKDVPQLAAMEAECFAPEEAASEARIRDRVMAFGDHYLILSCDGRDTAYVDAMATDETELRDEMYADASLHDPDGKWLMIFGLGCLPEFRNHGFAGQLMKTMQDTARREGREGIVLTCKDFMVPYYTRFGFENEGRSDSEHGGAAWFSMRWRVRQSMRRRDREVTDMEEIRAWLKRMKVAHLGLNDHGRVYVVPMHYGFDTDAEGTVLYLHSAAEGRKVQAVRDNPACFVEISESEAPQGGDEACTWGADYLCVMAEGMVELPQSDEEKRHGLEVLMLHQTGRPFEIPDHGLRNVLVWKVRLSGITAKRRCTFHG